MDQDRFNYIRDHILKLNNTQLSELLGVPDTSISNWSKGKRDIPEYITKTLELHVATKLRDIEIPLTLTELFALSDLAARRGTGVKELLLTLIRNALHTPDPADGHNDNIVYLPADTDLAKIAEDEPPYKNTPK